MTQQLTERAPQTTTPQTARNADLHDLARILQSQQERKLDVVAKASALRSRNGNLVISGVEPVIKASGVVGADGQYMPTEVADEGIAEKLGIPTAYLRRTRNQLPSLYDANVNGWLDQDPERRFMVRAMRADGAPGAEPGVGVARALLSPNYKLMDNFDLLMAALDGIRQAGHPVEITGCDLTDRRMYVRVESGAVAVQARELLKGYRSPFSGETGDEMPLVYAGFVISNSEVGSGAFSITPRAVFRVCSNGLTMTEDAMRSVHLGKKQEDGVIDWSGETQQNLLSLIASETTDAVRTFLSRRYVEDKLRAIEEAAGRPVKDPAKTIERVSKQLNIPKGVRDSILNHFITGGQPTAGGVLNAITATAQTLTNADAASDLEAMALPAMWAVAA
ncbi:DUF932 domain-containing protein [Streptomyces niveus]|uniref:DUF932 domain-containing protein n=1 Tax=Streptomyces niveus TaxID=193462 RepID=UPI0036AD68D6